MVGIDHFSVLFHVVSLLGLGLFVSIQVFQLDRIGHDRIVPIHDSNVKGLWGEA